MQYHFVLVWDEENGWRFDWDTLDARFPEGNVFAPNLGEWLKPVEDSETGDVEIELVNRLDPLLTVLNELSGSEVKLNN